MASAATGMNLRTPMRWPNPACLIGWALLLTAAVVAAGWILEHPLMTEFTPRAVMVLATALGFGLLAIALASGCLVQEHWHRHIETLTGGLVTLMGLLVLLEHGLGVDLSIDWPELHRRVDPDNPHPGQTSLPTAVAFVLAGLTLVLQSRVRETWQGLLVQATTSLVIALGVAGTLGWALRLDLVYERYLFGRMSLLTGLCFVLAGTALWLDWRRHDWYRSRRLIADEGLHINLSALALLAATLAIALAAAFGLVAREIDDRVRAQLNDTLKRRAELFRTLIELRAAQTELAADNPVLAGLLRQLGGQAADEKILAQLRMVAENLLAHGFSGAVIQGAAGRGRVEAGRLAGPSDIEIPLRERPATLLWDDGVVLRVRQPVRFGEAMVGSVLTEQRLHRLTSALEYAYDFAASGDLALCGHAVKALKCFPRYGDTRVLTENEADTAPAARALAGETGTRILRDARGVKVMAAYAPVGNFGLGLAIQADTSELYAPLREQFYVAAALLALMVLAGALLLRWRVAPIARRLFLHEHRLQLALDSSRSAVWDLDLSKGRVYLSEQWPVLLGGKPQASSTTLDDLYQLVHPEDLPHVQRAVRAALGRDALPYDVEHRVRTPSGEWTWIHSVGRVIERDARGKALRVIGVNTNIARRKLAESFIERRASRDEVTGLPNRSVFTDRLQTAMARSRRAPPDRSLMAVLIVGIEEFADIDAAVGREAGQAFLKEVTQRMQRCVRATDTIARTGRDEFTVILEELGLVEQARNIAEKIIDAVGAEMRVGQAVLTPNTSIGLAFYDGVIKVTAEELVANAQHAMYDARNEAPNICRVAPT